MRAGDEMRSGEARTRYEGPQRNFLGAGGVSDGTRTRDSRHHKPGLYQLSYAHQARVARPRRASGTARV